MYNFRSNLMIGFHGCSEAVRDKLVNSPNDVKISQEKYDWLGNGFYVWENNYERAKQWSQDKFKAHMEDKPSVVGVLFTLDNCLDFSDLSYTFLIEKYYRLMVADFSDSGLSIPKNRNTKTDQFEDKLFRELDCTVIEYAHQQTAIKIASDIQDKGFSNRKPFDTVRGIFTEGGPAFEGAGIQQKSHIQICIRNLNCIKGFFIPRKEAKL